MPEPLLRVDDLHVSYDGAVALDGVDLEVQPGELVSVIGANGAGKTTLLRAVSGIVTPSIGRVRWQGRDITRAPPWSICEEGLVQVAEGRQIFPSLSVVENLHIGGALKRARTERAETLGQVLALFPRLAERRRQKAGTLSGGEQQMLAIGRAMMARPAMVMLDEPSIGLSPLMTRTLFDAVRSLHAAGVTMLLVEQNVVESLRISDCAYVMENGRIVRHGSGASLLGDDAIRIAYLGL